MERGKLTNAYLSALCLELNMILNAGMTVTEGVEMLLADEGNKNSKMVLEKVLKNLDGGVSLSAAMKAVGYFPAHMINMMEIGEKTGRLVDALKALSEHYTRRERLAESIKNATTYPAVLLVMMLAVVMVLIVQVVPIFNDVFERMGTQMSPFALRIMDFGVWFRNGAFLIAVIFCAVLAAVLLVWVIPPLRERVSGGLRNVFGGVGIFGRVSSLHFISSMSMGVASGLTIEDAVSLAASMNTGTRTLSAKYEKCLKLLREGKMLAESLREAEVLTPRDGRLLSLGEKSGMSEFAMAEIARRSDVAVQDEIERAVGRIEPTLVIVTSVIVGVILLSVMMPLMGIMTTIG
jgi:type IV pilus assembly protein PilC